MILFSLQILLCLKWPYLDFLNLRWRSYLPLYYICEIVCLVFVNLLLAQQWYFKTEITHRFYHLIASLDLFELLTQHNSEMRDSHEYIQKQVWGERIF